MQTCTKKDKRSKYGFKIMAPITSMFLAYIHSVMSRLRCQDLAAPMGSAQITKRTATTHKRYRLSKILISVFPLTFCRSIVYTSVRESLMVPADDTYSINVVRFLELLQIVLPRSIVVGLLVL